MGSHVSEFDRCSVCEVTPVALTGVIVLNLATPHESDSGFVHPGTNITYSAV